MWARSARFARTAITRDMALTASSLFDTRARVSAISKELKRIVYHFGSRISVPSASVEALLTMTLQSITRAHILKAVAKGPKVPATSGKRVEENHHRLWPCQLRHKEWCMLSLRRRKVVLLCFFLIFLHVFFG